MAEKREKNCPTCQGKGVIAGTCSCSAEWRGTQRGDQWEDCQCAPEQPCPTCGGSGKVAAGKG